MGDVCVGRGGAGVGRGEGCEEVVKRGGVFHVVVMLI